MWDVSITNDMLGNNTHAVQGKKVKHQPDAVAIDQQNITVPSHTSKHCSNVELSADAMCVSDVPFLIYLSEHSHYGTIRAVDNLCYETLEDILKIVVKA